ncbi:16S rRNA (uracil(1498)-N(3))-methyltransferase [Bartonella sp. HY329]|uniref:16S rRNA (uracil(1498)-N(3))-methyltransferase n=1 Tax=unclassified Bartonella TaxID=2645622 RepID=UPI0021C9BACC|nr:MULTISPECIES: 16S rRNA (uracil(1498)-N(3))-methyltransferase [unclassified Bartonella]UXM95558.1 16S rRNA (uracil(1498)-N(3))-methyltransferase [Bartonella sp. HY329]UXN09883.1 16S rRNA (uracil(1498)-N(3))-methyltransferase [Bartonella sp. HY328]
MRANYKMQRLFVDQSFSHDSSSATGVKLALGKDQTHYLVHVLRMTLGSEVLLFNGREGEWRAKIIDVSKKTVVLELQAIERPQPKPVDLIYYFAPLKHARLDYMVQKAVEMGASTLQPVLTQHTQVTRLNLERMQANIIEAAEQCGILTVPSCLEPLSLERLLANWDEKRHLIFCDEAAEGDNPLPILQKLPRGPLGVIIGPEGGFSDGERKLIRSCSYAHAIALGPRILRADTAAVAALALIGATLGDWV